MFWKNPDKQNSGLYKNHTLKLFGTSTSTSSTSFFSCSSKIHQHRHFFFSNFLFLVLLQNIANMAPVMTTVAVLGDGATGVISQLLNSASSSDPESLQCVFCLHGHARRVEIVDFGLQKENLESSPQAFVLVFSVHSTESFLRATEELSCIEKIRSSQHQVPLVVVGLARPGDARQVGIVDGGLLARAVGARYTECNPDSDYGMLLPMTDLISKIPPRSLPAEAESGSPKKKTVRFSHKVTSFLLHRD